MYTHILFTWQLKCYFSNDEWSLSFIIILWLSDGNAKIFPLKMVEKLQNESCYLVSTQNLRECNLSNKIKYCPLVPFNGVPLHTGNKNGLADTHMPRFMVLTAQALEI